MIKFRLYFDKDKEEQWLNVMCQRGYAFKKFFLGFYSFEHEEPGKYNYQIDLLNNWSGDKSDYASFMEETGVKVISQWYRWVYLQKNASDGPFEMYTDLESKISHYHRIKNFFKVGLFIEMFCTLIEFLSAMESSSLLAWSFVILLGFITLTFFLMVFKCRWKMDQLRQERA